MNLKHCENLEKKDNNIYEERRIKIIKNKNLLLKKELEEKGLQGIFKHALSNSYKLTTPLIDQFFNIYNHVIKNKFYDPRYNDNILMLFSQMPLNSILSEQKILEFKSNKPNVYKQIIKKYLKDYNVLNEIIEIVSNNYIIDERQWIIEKGIEFYNKREYLLSITTLITQVEGIINRMKNELGFAPVVVATGGLASIIAEETDTIDIIDDFLSLEGLQLIYEMNR